MHARDAPSSVKKKSSTKEKHTWRWSVGVTAAPRAIPTLRTCLSSLASAGWTSPRIFAEPDCDVPSGYDITRRATCLGAWPNWYLSLAELVMVDPLADCYGLFQDDVVLCKNVGCHGYCP